MFSNILNNSQCFIGTVSRVYFVEEEHSLIFPLSCNPLSFTVLEVLSFVDHDFYSFIRYSKRSALEYSPLPSSQIISYLVTRHLLRRRL